MNERIDTLAYFIIYSCGLVFNCHFARAAKRFTFFVVALKLVATRCLLLKTNKRILLTFATLSIGCWAYPSNRSEPENRNRWRNWFEDICIYSSNTELLLLLLLLFLFSAGFQLYHTFCYFCFHYIQITIERFINIFISFHIYIYLFWTFNAFIREFL